MEVFVIIIVGQQKRVRRANLGGGGQRYLLKLYTAELEQNVGTFLAYLWNSNWYKWYVSEALVLSSRSVLSSLRLPARASCGNSRERSSFV